MADELDDEVTVWDEVWGADDYETAADTEADEFPPYVITEHAFAEQGLL